MIKLPEKSLFAILLRSPWWVSILIVLGFALVGFAFLPRDYAIAVVLGTFPFMVIAAMSARRQWKAPNPARLAAAQERAAAMNWREFAALLEQVFRQQGYAVTRLDLPGADFRLERQGRVLVLGCRRWKAASHGVEALRELEAARAAQDAQQASYMSLQAVSEAALDYARSKGLRLIAGPEIGLLVLQAEGPPAR